MAGVGGGVDGVVAPLDVQSSAAASLLLEGAAPEDVGAAAGLLQPGGWSPVRLAALCDGVVAKMQRARGEAVRCRPKTSARDPAC